MSSENFSKALNNFFKKRSKMFLFLFSHLNSIALTSKFKMRKRTKSIELNKEKENNLKKEDIATFSKTTIQFPLG